MTTESEQLSIVYQILIPSISSIASVLVIGWKIKDSLCKQINQSIIDFRVHVGISQADKKTLVELKEKLNRVITINGLKS